LEKYFELDAPIKSPRGLEAVFSLTKGATSRGRVEKFSAALYLYPGTFEDRGVQVAVIDCTQGLTASSLPLFFRSAFPW
jgi:NaMN:DMB phosphoribosyltransferase